MKVTAPRARSSCLVYSFQRFPYHDQPPSMANEYRLSGPPADRTPARISADLCHGAITKRNKLRRIHDRSRFVGTLLRWVLIITSVLRHPQSGQRGVTRWRCRRGQWPTRRTGLRSPSASARWSSRAASNSTESGSCSKRTTFRCVKMQRGGG